MKPQPNTWTSDPGYRAHYNVNSDCWSENILDDDGNPTGGEVILTVPTQYDTFHPVMMIQWQNGPRGPVTADQKVGPDGLLPPNGAFVEDVIWAAIQRLEFFNGSKYRCRENSLAITKLEEALFILKDRQLLRSARNVEGKHEV